MHIFFKNLDGKTIMLEVELDWKIKKVKEAIHAIEGIPIDQQQLLFLGKQLDDYDTLDHYNIEEEDDLRICFHLADPNPSYLMFYASDWKEQMESDEAEDNISANEKALVIGKCAEVLFLLKHRDNSSAAEEDKQLNTCLNAFRSVCEPIMTKLAKCKLYGYAFYLKKKMGSKEAMDFLTVDERVSLVGKCAEMMGRLEWEKGFIYAYEEISNRQREFENECKPFLDKMMKEEEVKEEEKDEEVKQI